MIVFAGIHEVTKELDDMAAYNFKTKQWMHLFGEYVAPKDDQPLAAGLAVHSPLKKQQTMGGNMSPSPNRMRDDASPVKMKSTQSQRKSVLNPSEAQQKTSVKKKNSSIKADMPRKRSPKKTKEVELGETDVLVDPTSITLLNSFLIKNAGPSFDNFHKMNMQNKKK